MSAITDYSSAGKLANTGKVPVIPARERSETGGTCSPAADEYADDPELAEGIVRLTEKSPTPNKISLDVTIQSRDNMLT
jgi:hypothetical protein